MPVAQQLSKQQVISAGAYSETEVVKKAYQKLEFALRMAHTQDEIEKLASDKQYHMRIGFKVSRQQYNYITVSWERG